MLIVTESSIRCLCNVSNTTSRQDFLLQIPTAWLKFQVEFLSSPAHPWYYSVQFSSVQSFSHVWLFVTPWITAHQASLSITNSQSPPKPMSIELVMPSNHLILCCPLLLLSPISPSIRAFSPWISSSHEVAKVLEFQLQHQSFQWTPRTDLL